MAITTREYAKINLEVSTLLQKHKIKRPPVKIKDIAEGLSLEVVPHYIADNISGVLMAKGTSGTIAFNPNDPEVRQRFTIAHELGHFILHRKNSTSSEQLFIDRDFLVKYRSSNKYSPSEYEQEQQANAFAATLLMPEEFVLAELAKIDYDDLTEIELIDALARVFEVSPTAMTYRLANLDINV
jgi:Zn-dependent peptidase ImmA (M78 family)